MDVVWAGLSLDDLHFHFFAQFFYDLDDVPTQLLIDHFPPILWCKYRMIFTSITGVHRVFYFIFHLPKTSLLFRDAVAKPS